MRQILASLLAAVLLLTCTSCASNQTVAPNMEPTTSQMRSICDLAVMECYYHNVAKYTEEDAEGILFWKKDKRFWIEYSGVVKIGVDASLITMDVQDTQVTISLPEAKVLSCKVDSSSLNATSYLVDQDSAKITAEDEVYALSQAQEQLMASASSDTALLTSAEQRVQTLLEDYITNIGNAVGKQYTIEWVYLDTDDAQAPSVQDQVPSDETEPASTAEPAEE